jgi:predicted dehydrogenase
MSMDAPLGIGLVGAGAFGQFCLKAFAAQPEVRIAAVADVDRVRAREQAALYGARAYPDLDSLLADAGVAIVALNTPPYLHHAQGLAVLNAGKHLFCEKPMALTEAEGQALIRLADERGVLLTVNYVMRHNPFWQAAAALRESGVLGALRHMDLANHAAGLDLPDAHWFWAPEQSGGIWIEHGVHFFDAFAWVAGQPGSITASQAFARSGGSTDRVEALARFGPAAAHFYHAFDQSGATEQTTVKLTFERGYVTLREWVPTSLELLTPVPTGQWQKLLPGAVSVTPLPDGRFRAIASAPEGKSAVYRQSIQTGLRNLVRAIQGNETLLVTGREGLASLAMACAACALAG